MFKLSNTFTGSLSTIWEGKAQQSSLKASELSVCHVPTLCNGSVPSVHNTLYAAYKALSLYHKNIKVDILANPVGLKQWEKGNGRAWTPQKACEGRTRTIETRRRSSQARCQEELDTAMSSKPTCPRSRAPQKDGSRLQAESASLPTASH